MQKEATDMNMKSCKPIPMDEHREIGRRIKIAERSIGDVLEYSHRFYSAETDKLLRADKNLGLIKSRLEDEMFREHPRLSNEEGFAVYYGNLEEKGEPCSTEAQSQTS